MDGTTKINNQIISEQFILAIKNLEDLFANVKEEEKFNVSIQLIDLLLKINIYEKLEKYLIYCLKKCDQQKDQSLILKYGKIYELGFTNNNYNLVFIHHKILLANKAAGNLNQVQKHGIKILNYLLKYKKINHIPQFIQILEDVVVDQYEILKCNLKFYLILGEIEKFEKLYETESYLLKKLSKSKREDFVKNISTTIKNLELFDYPSAIIKLITLEELVLNYRMKRRVMTNEVSILRLQLEIIETVINIFLINPNDKNSFITIAGLLNELGAKEILINLNIENNSFTHEIIKNKKTRNIFNKYEYKKINTKIKNLENEIFVHKQLGEKIQLMEKLELLGKYDSTHFLVVNKKYNEGFVSKNIAELFKLKIDSNLNDPFVRASLKDWVEYEIGIFKIEELNSIIVQLNWHSLGDISLKILEKIKNNIKDIKEIILIEILKAESYISLGNDHQALDCLSDLMLQPVTVDEFQYINSLIRKIKKRITI